MAGFQKHAAGFQPDNSEYQSPGRAPSILLLSHGRTPSRVHRALCAAQAVLSENATGRDTRAKVRAGRHMRHLSKAVVVAILIASPVANGAGASFLVEGSVPPAPVAARCPL